MNFGTHKLVHALKWIFSYISSFLLFQFRVLELMKTLSMKFWPQELTEKSEKLTESIEMVSFNVQQSMCLRWQRKSDMLFLKLNVSLIMGALGTLQSKIFPSCLAQVYCNHTLLPYSIQVASVPIRETMSNPHQFAL